MSNEINLQEFKMHEKDSGSSSYQTMWSMCFLMQIKI